MLKVGQKYKIKHDDSNSTYVVRGVDPTTNRFWLSVDSIEYDGYDGEIIIIHVDKLIFDVCLADSRSSLSTATRIALKLV